MLTKKTLRKKCISRQKTLRMYGVFTTMTVMFRSKNTQPKTKLEKSITKSNLFMPRFYLIKEKLLKHMDLKKLQNR